MNIASTDKEQVDIAFTDDTFDSFIDRLSEESDNNFHHLCLFLGLYTPNKTKALQEISKQTELSVQQFDLSNFIVKSEEESRKNLDTLFNKYSSSDVLLHFANGDKLCGAYTGFSHSRVKYASPQERHFLKRVKDFKGLVIVDISEYTAADKTIRRAAQSIIRFDLPNSIFQRFMWHLKNYTLHGFQLKTKRPDSYGEVPGNF